MVITKFIKLWLVLFCMLASSIFTSIQAQSQKFSYGMRFGPTVSMFTGYLPTKGMKKPKLGYTFGGYTLIRFKKRKWNFEAGFNFTTKGNNSKFVLDSGTRFTDYDFRYKLAYLEVPLLIRYYTNFTQYVRSYFTFGPTYSGLILARRKEKMPESKNFNVQNLINRDDFGLTLGYGTTFFAYTRWYAFDLRLTQGLINTNDYDGVYENTLTELKNGQIATSRFAEFRNTCLTFTFSIGLEKALLLKN